MTSKRIELVVFDWAGTTVDHGCFAPVSAFIEAFATRDIRATVAQAREPMGLHKRDHIRAMLSMPDIAGQWRQVAGQDWTEEDVEALYAVVTPLQVAAAQKFTDLVPGLLDCVAALRKRQIRIGTTTGYPREVAQPVIESAARQGYDPDYSVCADEVQAGRPEPWLIYRNMEHLRVFPPSAVVKVGDTVPDVEAGFNAGVWSVGVTQTGSDVGCTESEFAELPFEEQQRRLAAAKSKLQSAGAHAVLRTLAELPGLIDELEAKLNRGERP